MIRQRGRVFREIGAVRTPPILSEEDLDQAALARSPAIGAAHARPAAAGASAAPAAEAALALAVPVSALALTFPGAPVPFAGALAAAETKGWSATTVRVRRVRRSMSLR
jgi:hypothetical protein